MDEVIEGISCSVIREMPIEQGAVRVLVCGRFPSERGQPIPCRRRVKNPPNRLRVEIDLLSPFWIGYTQTESLTRLLLRQPDRPHEE